MGRWRVWAGLGAGALLGLLLPVGQAAAAPRTGINCATDVFLCAEVTDQEAAFGENHYVGHDEPMVTFYSNKRGSGNEYHTLLQLPKDPPAPVRQNGSGGTFNFQLHPAFWFSMELCDSQSSPEFTTQCTPDSDSNIADNPDPASPQYFGRHPGTAFMEMQFYPPGWANWAQGGSSCDVRQWCGALNVDSLSIDMNNNVRNNAACLASAGVEPVNFAFVTRDGKAQAPADPLHQTAATFTPDPQRDLFMRSGDVIAIDMSDSAGGLRIVLRDLSTGQSGSMTAGRANGFGQVNFQPNSSTCTSTPYDFHPMYSTNSVHTDVPWGPIFGNVAFSDEIGHFEYCSQVDQTQGTCTGTEGPGAGSPVDSDDNFCFAASQLSAGSQRVSGCQGTDGDFDGPEYARNWPGTSANPLLDRLLHAQPIRFTTPTSDGVPFDGAAQNTDLPEIEASTTPACNRTTGAGCANPPAGASFYPFYTTHNVRDDGRSSCFWQFGGAHIPGTTNTFGGTSTSAFGPLTQVILPGAGFKPRTVFSLFRRPLGNACRSGNVDPFSL